MGDRKRDGTWSLPSETEPCQAGDDRDQDKAAVLLSWRGSNSEWMEKVVTRMKGQEGQQGSSRRDLGMWTLGCLHISVAMCDIYLMSHRPLGKAFVIRADRTPDFIKLPFLVGRTHLVGGGLKPTGRKKVVMVQP